MLVTLAWIALLVGLVLVVLGYTVAPAARVPGIVLAVVGVVVLIVAYALPAFHAPDDGYAAGHVVVAAA